MAIKLARFRFWPHTELGRRSRVLRWTTSVVIILMVATIVCMVNVWLGFREIRWDWSETHRFTLAPQTVEALRALHHDVMMYAFVQKSTEEERAATDLLESYRAETLKVRYEVIDPNQRLTQAKELGVNQYGTVVVTTPNGRRAFATGISEAEVTGALTRAVRERGPAIYFVQGHQEHELTDDREEGYSQLAATLTQQGYTPKSVQLLSHDPIPTDASTVVIAGPKDRLQPDEVERIVQYLARGGRLVVLADPQIETGLEALLAHWGVVLGSGVIVDQQDRTLGGASMLPLISIYSTHEIVRQLRLPTLFPQARPLFLDVKSPEFGLTFLAQSSDRSWAELGMQAQPLRYDPNREEHGPFDLAVAVAPRDMTSDFKGGPRLIVVGDSDFLSNAYFSFSGNRDLFLNMVSWLMEGLDSIVIRPHAVNGSAIILSEHHIRMLFVVLVVATPLLITCSGWGIWRYRRMRL